MLEAPATRRLSFFVVIGKNRYFPATEVGRFLASSEHGAIRRARRIKPELTSGLKLEAYPA